MKTFFFTILAMVFAMMLISAGKAFYKMSPLPAMPETKEYAYCEPAPANIVANASGKFISVLPGWGHHAYKISTGNDSAQFYFNQGLNFYYSYHFREALASFKEAVRFDQSCAMAYWGQALAMGPYYNNFFYKMSKEVPAVIKSMNNCLSRATEKETALIKAMQQRYSNDTTNSDRKQLDSNYAVAMLLLTKQYASDDDIKALYVDAVMLSHKWDFWYNDGRPKAWTSELVQACELMLKKNPDHPAALHYFIHLTEASKHPELALHSADVLKESMPGVGHMVHMATHMYQRNGLFAKGVFVNEDANSVNNRVDSLAPYLGIGKNSLTHVYAVQSYCAMNAGMFVRGMPVYMRARNRMIELKPSISDDAYAQYVYMMPVMAWVRLGKWQEIMRSPAPDAGWKYALTLDDFAKGIAQVRNKNLSKAKEYLANLQANMLDSLLAIRLMPFNKPVQCAKIAEQILLGEILYEEGKQPEALAAFKLAVDEEDKLTYREPKDWLIPSRQYLGACLLKMNMLKEAERVYHEDLINNPGNGWSLFGLYKSISMQKKESEAAEYRAAFNKAFLAADVKLENSVF